MISPVEPVRDGGGGGRAVGIVISGIVLGLALSIVKPWGAESVGDPGATDRARAGGEPRAAAPPTPPATPSPTPDPLRRICLAPDGWRVMSVEVFDVRTVRTWQTIVPVEATGPSDPDIPVGRVISSRVLALGWCSPIDGTETETEAVRARAWRLGTDGTAERLALRVGAAESGRGGEYRPPADAGGDRPGEWRPGRYVFAIEGPEPGTRWFAVDIIRFVAAPSEPARTSGSER
jgi:hypothetical protein